MSMQSYIEEHDKMVQGSRCEICDRLFVNNVKRTDGGEFGHNAVCTDCLMGMEWTITECEGDEWSNIEMTQGEIILLVFGGRNFNDRYKMWSCLDSIKDGVIMVVEGGARGADTLAKEWAHERGIHVAEVNALWDTYPYKAGYKRNNLMPKLGVTHAVKFPGGNGTDHMLGVCKKLGIPVWEIV